MTIPVATTTKLKPEVSVSVKRRVNSSETPCTSLLRLSVMIFTVFGVAGGWYMWQYNTQGWLNTHYVNNNGEYVVSSLDDQFSTLFCDKYTVDSNTRADVFLVKNGAKVSRQFREIITLTETDAISVKGYAYFSTYLLAGSTIKVKGCRILDTPTEAQILLIKGDDSWQSWKTSDSDFNLVKSARIKRQEVCDFQQMFDLEYTVSSDDSYYIVLEQGKRSEPRQETYVFTRLTLNKTIYDLHETTQFCENSRKCTVDLEFSSEQDIIVKFPKNPNSHTRLASFSTTCEKRLMFWLGIFAILPLTMVVLMSACCCFCYVIDKRQRKMTRKRNITKALIDNSDTIPVRPPSYEEVTKPLPSYSVNMP